MFFDLNNDLCEKYKGLNPLELLDYPLEDVFDLIQGLMDHNRRKENDNQGEPDVIRKKAGDNWF